MTISYNLFSNPIWQFTDSAGNFLSGGFVYSYRALNHDEQKPLYSDPAGTIPYTNPIELSSSGAVGPIYGANDEAYYIVITDQNNLPIYEINNLSPGSGGGGPITEINDLQNYLINAQFRYNIPGLPSPIPPGVELLIAPGQWYFFEDGSGNNDAITFPLLPFGENPPPETPTYVLNYNESSTPVSQTTRRIYYKILDSNSFSGQVCSFSFWAKSDIPTTVGYGYIQNFGTGGSPQNKVTLNSSVTVLTSFNLYTEDGFTVQDISAFSRGTNDYFAIFIDIPLNVPISNLKISSLQWQETPSATPFLYQTALQDLYQTYAFTNVPDKVKVDSSDTTAGYLNSKIVAGTGIATAILNPGANEQIQISSTITPIDFILNYTYVPYTTQISKSVIGGSQNSAASVSYPSQSHSTHIDSISYTVLNTCNLKITCFIEDIRKTTDTSNPEQVLFGLYSSLTGSSIPIGACYFTANYTFTDAASVTATLLAVSPGSIVFDIYMGYLSSSGGRTTVINEGLGGNINNAYFEFTEYKI